MKLRNITEGETTWKVPPYCLKYRTEENIRLLVLADEMRRLLETVKYDDILVAMGMGLTMADIDDVKNMVKIEVRPTWRYL